MPDPRDIAERWASSRSSDPTAHVTACYEPDAVLVGLDGTPLAVGRDAVAAFEVQAFLQVPDRRCSVARVLADAEGSTVVVEGLQSGRDTVDAVPMSAPVLCWWRLDAAGLIVEEHRYLPWDRRRILDDDSFSRPPRPDDARRRSAGAVRDLVARWAEAWAWDAGLAVDAFVADDVAVRPDAADPTVVLEGAGAWRAREVAARAAVGPAPVVRVDATVGAGDQIALRVAFGAGAPEVLLVVLDDADRFVRLDRFAPHAGGVQR